MNRSSPRGQERERVYAKAKKYERLAPPQNCQNSEHWVNRHRCQEKGSVKKTQGYHPSFKTTGR